MAEKKGKIRSMISDYLMILLGSCIVSVGFVFFINPYKFVPGGVYGTSIVLHNLMPKLQVGTFGYIVGIPLLILSYFVLGKGLGAKTLFTTLVTPCIMNILSAAVYPDESSLQLLAPDKICNGMLNLSENLILAVVIGSVIIGFGTGFIIKGHATSGGTDILAMIAHKYLRVKFSNALITIDAIIVSFGLLVIGFGIGTDKPAENTWMLSGYSLICIFLMSRTLAYIVSGSKNNKLMFLVVDEDDDVLRDFIINHLDRTATVLNGKGLYSQKGKMTLMMMVRMREVEAVTTAIKGINPEVFIIVTDAYDAYGKRWKAFPDKHSIELS